VARRLALPPSAAAVCRLYTTHGIAVAPCQGGVECHAGSLVSQRPTDPPLHAFSDWGVRLEIISRQHGMLRSPRSNACAYHSLPSNVCCKVNEANQP
jgi:hypothetical protein